MALGFPFRRTGPATSATPVTPHGRLRQSPAVLATAHEDEMVLLDLRREQYCSLTAVASRVWSVLADGVTQAEIVEVIRREYEVPAGREGDPVESDVARLLAQMLEAGLVISSDAPSPERP